MLDALFGWGRVLIVCLRSDERGTKRMRVHVRMVVVCICASASLLAYRIIMCAAGVSVNACVGACIFILVRDWRVNWFPTHAHIIAYSAVSHLSHARIRTPHTHLAEKIARTRIKLS